MSDPVITPPAEPTAIAQFKQDAARALITLTENSRLRRGDIASVLQRAGIDPYGNDDTVRLSTTAGEAVSLKLDESDNHAPMPDDVEPGELTAEAVARRDAEYLAQLRKQFWSEVSRRASDFGPDASVQALRDLGFGDQNLPKVTTSVSGSLVTGVLNRYGDPDIRSFAATLDNEHDKADIEQRLRAAAPVLPEEAMLRSAFGDTQMFGAVNFPTAVQDLYVSKQTVWPKYTA